jgi:hypothetical protein
VSAHAGAETAAQSEACGRWLQCVSDLPAPLAGTAAQGDGGRP